MQSYSDNFFKDFFKGVISEAMEETIKTLVEKKSEKNPSGTSDGYMSRREAAKYIGSSLPSLHKYTLNGEVTAFRCGGKVLYKKHDLDLLKQIKTFKS